MTENENENENETITTMNKLGEQLGRIFPGQGFVLITYNQLTDEVLNFVSNDTQSLPYVFTQIIERLNRINLKSLYVSRRIGNA
jgi:hypothetical protein